MNLILKRSLVFVVNLLVSTAPVLVVSPLLFYYLFSNSEADQVAGIFALLNTSILVPFFYLFFSLVFSSGKNPGEKLAGIELSEKSFLIVLKRVAPFVVLFYVLFFLQLHFAILAFWVFYISFIFFSKKHRSLADVFSKTHYLFPVK